MTGEAHLFAQEQPFNIQEQPFTLFAYVVNRASGTISAYNIDQDSGALTKSGVDVDAGKEVMGFPFSITVVPNGKYAYVPNNKDKSVRAYKIDQKTGALKELGDYETGDNSR